MCYITAMIKTFVVGKQSSFNFTQRTLTGNLSKQQSQKLFPCSKIFTVSVTTGFFTFFFKTISGDDVEKLRIDAIVIYCSGFCVKY